MLFRSYQYMRIWNAHEPGTFALVAGPDGYTLAIARGTHYYPEDLDTKYRVEKDGVTEIGKSAPPVKLDMYFFVDWKWPEDPYSNARGEARVQESEKLENWIQSALKRGLPLAHTYHDTNLDVWALEYKPEPFDLKKELRSVGISPADRVGRN